MKTIPNCFPLPCKKVSLFLLFSALSLLSFAQTTLATWEGQVLTPTTAANVTAQNVTGPSVSVYNNGTNTPSRFYIGSNGAAANLSYLDFVLQPASGMKLDITNMSFRISGMNTAATYSIRSSLDGYVSNLATGTATMNMSPYTTFDTRSHALAGLNNITSPVTLRVYKSSGGDMLHIYNVQVVGTVANIILPLHFTAFTAKKQAGGIGLFVSTENEKNTDYLLVERLSEGGAFIAIGKMPAGPQAANTYSFMDRQPNSSTNVYRIKQVDKDGRFSYSKLVSMDGERAPAVRIAPNPAKDLLQVSLPIGMGNTTITIKTISGLIVQSARTFGNTNHVKMDISGLSKGIYLVAVSSESGTEFSQKLIKE